MKPRVLHIGFANPRMSLALAGVSSDYAYVDWTGWTAVPGNVENLRRHTIETAERFRPDVTLMQIQSPGVYDADTVSRIPGLVVNWTWDVRRPTPAWILDLAAGGTVSAFTNEADVRDVRAAGYRAEFLQSGFDDEVFRLDGTTSEYPEIVFMGNNYRGEHVEFPLTDLRIEMVARLRERFGERFGVYGFGWGGTIFQNFMHREWKEAECYRSCKVAINLSHYDVERYTSDRLLRLMASGAMCLTRRWPQMERDFTDGVHLVSWTDIDDLCEKIDWYVRDDNAAARLSIAESGCELVHRAYKWDNFAEQLIRLI